MPVTRSSFLISGDVAAEVTIEEEGGAVAGGLEELMTTRWAGGGWLSEVATPPPYENTPGERAASFPEAVSLLDASSFCSYFSAVMLGVVEDGKNVVCATLIVSWWSWRGAREEVEVCKSPPPPVISPEEAL